MQPITPHTVPPTADDDRAVPPDGHAAARPATAGASHVPARSRLAALVGAALVAGGGLGFVVGHGTASTASVAGNTPATFAGSGAAGARGGVAGEQHILGTLSARTGSTITVKSSSGTSATYTLDSTTQIVRNGQTVGLSSLQVGDPVQVHVYPSSSGSTMLVELVLAGSSATSGPSGGFGGPPSGAAPSGTGGGSSTGTATTPTTLN